jgi:hypothetical protein
MGCKQRTVKIAKSLAAQLAPPVVRFAADMVGLLQTTDWSNDAKRETAVTLTKARASQLGQEVKESAIRVAVEVAVNALKEGTEALEELGVDDSAVTITESV